MYVAEAVLWKMKQGVKETVFNFPNQMFTYFVIQNQQKKDIRPLC
jgi:hypothetical protein